MKTASTKMFFTVMWKGVCQAFKWFFGLFGYKKDGKFAKCIWGVFAISATIIVFFMAATILYASYNKLSYRYHSCEDPDCLENTFVSRDIYFHNHGDGKGYIFNIHTGEKYVKGVAWIAKPLGNDSLVCFSDGKKRGYFNRYTGEVTIKPQYNHAWVFSEGLAAVEEDCYIKFIDTKGNVVIDNKIPYDPWVDGNVFHSGYCIVGHDNSYGMIDRKGNFSLPMEYDYIFYRGKSAHWGLKRGKEMAVVNDRMQEVLPFSDWSLSFSHEGITATMNDNTIRKYDLKGNLINDFCFLDVHILEYETDEIQYKIQTVDDTDDQQVDGFHPKATSRLMAYVAGNYNEGLITKDGHVVTMPLYSSINAIGPDTYFCTMGSDEGVILNGKGEIVSKE